MTKTIIFGATGNIGSALARQLHDDWRAASSAGSEQG